MTAAQMARNLTALGIREQITMHEARLNTLTIADTTLGNRGRQGRAAGRAHHTAQLAIATEALAIREASLRASDGS